MTRDDRDANEKIREILRSAYFEKEDIDISSFWQGKVMAHVRELAALKALHPSERFMEALGQLLWRLSPLIAFLVIVAGAALILTDFTSEYDVAQLFFSEPLDAGWDLQI